MSRAQQNFWNTLRDAVQRSNESGEAIAMRRMVHLGRPCGCDEWPIAAFVYWPSRIWIFECHACFATFTDSAESASPSPIAPDGTKR